MDERRRSLLTWAIAGIVHIGVLAFALRPVPPRATEAPVATLEVEPGEIEVEAPPSEPTDPTATPNEATPTSATAPTRVAAMARSATTGAPGMGNGEGIGALAGASSAEPGVAGSNSTWVVNLGGAEGHGWNAQQRLGTSRQATAADEAALAEQAKKDNSIQTMLRLQDAAKGLGPDGPVLHALEDETRTSLAPTRGNATFRAVVDAMGNVTALKLLDSEGDRAGWDDARERALAVLQKKKLDLKGANGALIDVRVESLMRLPDGTVVGEGPVRSVDGRLSLAGDLSNIGAHPQRVVHVRLSNYTPL